MQFTDFHPRTAVAEAEDGLATTLVKSGIFQGLQAQGADLNQLRIGQHLVDAQGQRVVDGRGRPLDAKPDISYVTPRGTRVNIELDTTASSALAHARHNNADPRAWNYYLVVDPATNRVTGAVVRNPSGSVVQVSRARAQQLAQGRFPRPAAQQPGTPQRKRQSTVRDVRGLRTAVARDQRRRRR